MTTILHTISVSFDTHSGLTADDKVTCATTDSEGASDIIVPLVQITVWKTSGTTVAPVNRDLPCLVNGEALASEVNLLSGNIDVYTFYHYHYYSKIRQVRKLPNMGGA